MSKAFTRESDDLPERPPAAPPPSPLPPGARNYLTPDGAKRLADELEQRRRDASATRLPSAPDARLSALERILPSIEIVPPPAPPHDQVRFGAVVTYVEAGGAEETVRIVGIDETDAEQSWISWLSPLARSLLNARVGQRVRLKLPAGEREMVVKTIAYP